jgi:hypothetical protein
MTRKPSEKRQRSVALAGRFTPQEAATVRAKADNCGGVSALIRALTLDAPPPRNRTDREAIVRLMTRLADVRAELGKSGSNLNQIAYHLNAGRPGDRVDRALMDALDEQAQAVRTLEELRLACMQSLGFERKRPPPET